jgi:hypothetical protein
VAAYNTNGTGKSISKIEELSVYRVDSSPVYLTGAKEQNEMKRHAVHHVTLTLVISDHDNGGAIG